MHILCLTLYSFLLNLFNIIHKITIKQLENAKRLKMLINSTYLILSSLLLKNEGFVKIDPTAKY